MKQTYNELLTCVRRDEAIDMRAIQAEEVGGHDVVEGPCSCGAWHHREPHILALFEQDEAGKAIDEATSWVEGD